MVPILPLDGGHIAGALYEGLRRQIARIRRKPLPGPVDTAKMLPVAYAMSIFLIAMSAVVILADVIKPLSF
jgi:membrane-associated protease RseP (regulator of RpoE activity)